MKEFYTRQTANEGVTLPLYLPDGSPTEHWIKVRGVDSDQFRQAETKAKRKAIEIAQVKDAKKRDEQVRETEVECIASLVSAWSFEQEPTLSNVVMFLTEAPQICDMVNRFAARRTEFFRKKSVSSAIGSKRRSSSKSSRKVQKSS